MLILCAAVCGFALDMLLGDPARIPHPVVFMGRCVTHAETFLRARLPKTPRGELLGGAILAASLPLLTFAATLGLCRLAARTHPAAGFALQALWAWQCVAVRGLADAARAVYAARDLPGARAAVSRIVGRDTARLDESGVIRAAVESVAVGAAVRVATSVPAASKTPITAPGAGMPAASALVTRTEASTRLRLRLKAARETVSAAALPPAASVPRLQTPSDPYLVSATASSVTLTRVAAPEVLR